MRAVRFLGAVVLACASVPVVSVGTAHAETASLVPSNAGYFWSLGLDKPEQSPASTPNLTGQHADGVGPDHLAVAANGGREDKVSFLYFDLFTLPADITVTRAVVTMKVVNDPPDDVTVQAAPEKVVACKAGDQGFSGDDAAGITNAPFRLCDSFSAKGTVGATDTYQWDVTGLAQTWVTGINDGVALTRSDASPNSNFQVVFDSAPTATLQLEYSLPVTVPEGPLVPPGVPSGGPPPLPPTEGDFVPEPVTPIEPNPSVNVPPAPVTQPPATSRNVALETSLRPENQLWLAALGLGAILLLLSLIMGDPRVASATRSTSRLSLALAGNRRLVSVGVMRPRHL